LIPSSVTSIGNLAFVYCYNLQSIYVDSDNGVYADIDGILYNKAKTKVLHYPKGRKKSTFDIPNSVESISLELFDECQYLKSITIPGSVTNIDEESLANRPNLEAIYVSSNNQVYADVDGVLYNKAKSTLLSYPRGRKATTFNMPDTVTDIHNYAFFFSLNLNSITLSNNLISIGREAFSNCYNLTSIIIPSSVTNINANAFYDCRNLIEVKFLGDAPTLGDEMYGPTAFGSCSPNLKIYYLHDKVGFTDPWDRHTTIPL